MKVRVENGKYTFVMKPAGLSICRHGESWGYLANCSNAVHSMMCELDAARVVVAAARSLEKHGEAPASLKQALRLHEALVGDNEHPSEWAVPSEGP